MVQIATKPLPLSEKTLEHATRGDLFLVASLLFRACLHQQTALNELALGKRSEALAAVKLADRELDDLYHRLRSDGDEE